MAFGNEGLSGKSDYIFSGEVKIDAVKTAGSWPISVELMGLHDFDGKT
jgi:hypothetical protein